ALLFFLHGARLARQAALAGARHGRLHLLVFLSTFALFPALGLGARALFPHLLPFATGQALRPWIGGWAERNRRLLSFVDRGSILLVVYAAFSEGMVAGIWHTIDAATLARLFVVDATLLAAVLAATTLLSRWLGFSRADEITIVFCGSKKSLASGLPMASVLFAGSS